MNRTRPSETKLLICHWHPFSEWRPKPSLAEAIRKRWPEMHVVHLPTLDNLAEQLPDSDILVVAGLRQQQQWPAAKKLKWIHSTAAGVRQWMYPEFRDLGVLLTNTSGVFSIPMAEHTMGLLLAMARNFPDSVRYQDQQQWSQQVLWDKPQHLTELNGQVLLIVGYGSIGRELARRARAFDMRVWGVTRSGKGDTTLAEKIAPASQMDELLPQADYVVLAVPETDETMHLLGPPQFAKMKHGARLVNIGRGALVDETALLQALETGVLSSAAIDVAATEPLPRESPLWSAPNLFITPHVSGVSERLWKRHEVLLLDLLERWFDGRELYNLVDFAKGY